MIESTTVISCYLYISLPFFSLNSYLLLPPIKLFMQSMTSHHLFLNCIIQAQTKSFLFFFFFCCSETEVTFICLIFSKLIASFCFVIVSVTITNKKKQVLVFPLWYRLFCIIKRKIYIMLLPCLF